jgi:hypothetical protein
MMNISVEAYPLIDSITITLPDDSNNVTLLAEEVEQLINVLRYNLEIVYKHERETETETE